MGNVVDRGLSLINLSRTRSSDNDPSSVYHYSYPTKNGQPYFSPHFIMGGERFESFQPESFLFGENLDLNFLGSKPTPFPYAAPQPTEPTRAVRSLLNIRKESVRFVRVTDPNLLPKEEKERSVDDGQPHQPAEVTNHKKDKSKDKDKSGQSEKFYYNIEFTFDSDVSCCISIYYFATEETSASGVTYHPRDWSICHEKVLFSRGANQSFSQAGHIFCPSNFNEGDLHYRAFDENGLFDGRVPFPFVIHIQALEGDEPRQSHSLMAVIERNNNLGSYTLKPFIQKMFIDGLHFLLQEVYGIENKSLPATMTNSDGKTVTRYISPEEEAEESSAAECVVCLSDPRDTLILPCRHLCLCNACADSLRYQANNCPICRAPFRALLQIRAVRRMPIMTAPSATVNSTVSLPIHIEAIQDGVPPGYEGLPLVEALNGPMSPGIWSSHLDIERTPVSVRRSHRKLNDRIYKHGHGHHHHHHHHSRSGNSAAAPAAEETIPLPSRRIASPCPSSQGRQPPSVSRSHVVINLPKSPTLEKIDPPEPAPIDYQVMSTSRIRRKGSDEDPETSSSTSSTHPHETTRLLSHVPDEDAPSFLVSRSAGYALVERASKAIPLTDGDSPPTPDVYGTSQRMSLFSNEDAVSASSTSFINPRAMSGSDDDDEAYEMKARPPPTEE